jgi:uncharacterized membrane protein
VPPRVTRRRKEDLVTRQRWQQLPQIRALAWVLPCIAFWSLIPRLASNPGNLDAFGFLFWSSAVSAACLLVCTRVTGHWRELRAYSMTDVRRISALATLGAFFYYALLYSAYAPCGGPGCEEKAAIVVITQYTWPALTVLWSAALLRERLTCRLGVSLLLGIVAVAIGASGTRIDGEALTKLPIVVLAAVVFGLTPLLAAVFADESILFHAHHWVGIGLVLTSALLATITRDAADRAPLPPRRRYYLAEESR